MRSSHATIEPAACASAASRSASVVRPLDTSPRSATPIPRGTPPGPRIASSSANPVERTRSRIGSRGRAGSVRCGEPVGHRPRAARSPARPRPPRRVVGRPALPRSPSASSPGAAAPQRDRRVASAAVRSGAELCHGRSVSNRCSNESRPCPEPPAPSRPLPNRRHTAPIRASAESGRILAKSPVRDRWARAGRRTCFGASQSRRWLPRKRGTRSHPVPARRSGGRKRPTGGPTIAWR